MQDTSGQSVNVSIIGASGYTGAELLRLLLFHPFVNVVHITSRQFEGKKLVDVFPHFRKSKSENLIFESYDKKEISEDSDLVFSCLPHKASFPIVKELFYENESIKIVDFSADFRFSNVENYERVYETENTAKELFKFSSYGLPEINRENIGKGRIVANPGCYPTSVILPLYPLVKNGVIDTEFPVIADSKSGVTGAGRKINMNFLFCEANESFKAYSVEGHRHGPEIAEKLGLKKVRFTPHLVPMNRGILSTVYFKTDFSKEEMKKVLDDFYNNEFFVRVVDMPPKTSDVAGTNFCDIYITKDESTGLGVVVSVIDNIGKGASGQAVQNMNIVCKFPENTGLDMISRWI